MVTPQVERLGRGDAPTLPEVVIKEQTGPKQQTGAAACHLRQDEALRPDNVAGVGQKHFALLQRLANETEFEVLEITQAAVDELRARGRGGAAEIGLLDEQHF